MVRTVSSHVSGTLHVIRRAAGAVPVIMVLLHVITGVAKESVLPDGVAAAAGLPGRIGVAMARTVAPIRTLRLNALSPFPTSMPPPGWGHHVTPLAETG